jgi:hypothetical protein
MPIPPTMNHETHENMFCLQLVTTPALVGICLGATLFLVTMAAVTCFCYRKRSPYTHKLYSKRSSEKPVTLRKPTAVRSPNSGPTTHFLKKTPSPTGNKSPPGVCNGFAKTPTAVDAELGNGKRRGSRSVITYPTVFINKKKPSGSSET